MSDAEERAAMERLGIDPGLSRRHQLRKLYPFLRGIEKATTQQVETLVTGALQRENARFVTEERRRQRLHRALPYLAVLAVVLLLALVLVFIPDLVFLRHA